MSPCTNRKFDSAAMGGLANLADSGESPSQCLLRKERELQIADALAQLSADHREVIILRNLQRLPFDEVAQRMGRTTSSVAGLLHRALKSLKETLPAADEADEGTNDAAFAPLLAPSSFSNFEQRTSRLAGIERQQQDFIGAGTQCAFHHARGTSGKRRVEHWTGR